MMQAKTNRHENEIECIGAIFKAEGFRGFLGRGLNPQFPLQIYAFAEVR